MREIDGLTETQTMGVSAALSLEEVLPGSLTIEFWVWLVSAVLAMLAPASRSALL